MEVLMQKSALQELMALVKKLLTGVFIPRFILVLQAKENNKMKATVDELKRLNYNIYVR